MATAKRRVQRLPSSRSDDSDVDCSAQLSHKQNASGNGRNPLEPHIESTVEDTNIDPTGNNSTYLHS